MKPTTVVITAASGSTARSSWIVPDRLTETISISFGVVVAGSNASYTVQHTFQDVGLVGTVGVTAAGIFDHPAVSGQTVNADGNYAYPVGGISVLLTGASADGNTATLTVTQGGN